MKKVVGGQQLKTQDRVGGTIYTELYKLEDDTFQAFSTYWQDEDEEVVGVAEGLEPLKIVKQSRKSLRKEWIELQAFKKNNPDYKPPFSFELLWATVKLLEDNHFIEASNFDKTKKGLIFYVCYKLKN